MSGNEFTRLFKYIEKRFSDMDSQFTDLHKKFDRLQGSLEAYAKQVLDLTKEHMMLGHKLDLRKIPVTPEAFSAQPTNFSVPGCSYATLSPDKVTCLSLKITSGCNEVPRKSSKVDRLEQWIQIIAQKSNIKLEY